MDSFVSIHLKDAPRTQERKPAVAPELCASMRGQNIVCFAKDWSEDPTSCNYVMRELSRHNKVLWLNSISTRSPNLASGRGPGQDQAQDRRLPAGTQSHKRHALGLYSPRASLP